ncbi:iron export ABC transporter permease subunit FetB [Acidihalobacter aeolianus]|uniref:Iron export ABC transporter permease subunit FetB n=1 Tax=Acidihalobacter aeolianus TaxID=2792603 RepID=A0A1D8K4P9_9GAMM|nr:iron export ABC transporter permease subunit FetB [Acidihalobacter aeolianus]AOV15933.1 iron export ABC transporter permease subunit FetB [Acidihalobacter aeolianus]
MHLIALTPFELGLAALLILALAGLSLALSLGLSKTLLIAAVRTTLQLWLVGLVLKTLFAYASPLWIGLLAAFMLLVAGREVMARQQRRFRGGWGYGVGAIALTVPSLSIILLTLLVILRPEPWYAPQYAIPLLGMLIGNSMTGAAIGLDRLTQTAWRQRAAIEARLMLGQRWDEAMSDIRRESARAGLIPIINSMAAAGVVSLPGMMTGQILAGAPPTEAVRYQILIMFLIAANTGFAALGGVWFGSRRLFDERERLRLDRLKS